MKRLLITLALLTFRPSFVGANADSLYQAALTLPNDAGVEARIRAFKRVVKKNPNYAPAHNQLAQLYMQYKKPESRQNAKYAVVRAIKSDPHNVTYEVTLGRLLREQNAFLAAEKQFQRILKKHPNCADAHYYLGTDLLEQYLAVKAEVKRGAHLFANESLNRAESHLKKSVEYNPKNRQSAFRLGLLYLESNRPEKLVQLMLNQLKSNPQDKEIVLYCALGFRHMGDWQKAGQLYEEAIKRMTGEERSVIQDLEYVAEPKQFHHNDGSNLQNQDESFWRKQDPLMLTPHNERLLEHYSRVAYAGLRFGLPEHNTQGWNTDMGRTYIRFGPALKRIRIGQRPVGPSRDRRDAEKLASPIYKGLSDYEMEVEKFFAQHGLPQLGYTQMQAAARETWHYENFNVQFESYIPRGEWTFGGKVLEEVYEDAKRGLLAYNPTGGEVFYKQGPRFVDPYSQFKYQPPHLVAAFWEGNRTRVELAYALPKNRLTTQKNKVALTNGLFLFDSDWNVVKQDIKDVAWLPNMGQDSLRSRYLLAQNTLHLQPGQYNMIAEILDRQNNSIGTFRNVQTWTVPDSGLALSDLLLASQIQTRTPFPETRQDLHITPNPLRTYKSSDSVFLYLEVYNLKRGSFGHTRFDITYRVSLPQQEDIDPGLFSVLDTRLGTVEVVALPDSGAVENALPNIQVQYHLPKRNKIREAIRRMRGIQNNIETSVSAEYEGTKPNDFTFLEIDVGQLPENIYQLTVTVTDQLADTTAEQHTFFKIIR